MKQLVTIFRAESEQASRLADLCSSTPVEELFSLRDAFRDQAVTTHRFTGYLEFVDSWSMGHDFESAVGKEAHIRKAVNGEVYCVFVTDVLRGYLQAESKRKHQFAEQQWLANCLLHFANSLCLPDRPVTLAVFREIVGVSMTDEEAEDALPFIR